MELYTAVLIGIGLSMDAFAVAMVKGMCAKDSRIGTAIKISLYFGVFQAGMVLIGYLLGITFSSIISSFDHWIAFFLLLFIGGKMIYEGLTPKDLSCDVDPKTDFISMITVSIATSIDALAVGVSFAFLNEPIVSTALLIGCITFTISLIGVQLGKRGASWLGDKAELLGGLVLILIGVKILIEHLL